MESWRGRAVNYANKALEERGVKVHAGTGVRKVGPASIELANGETVKTHTLIWAAGLKANPIVQSLGVELGHGGRIPVGPDLQWGNVLGGLGIDEAAVLPQESGDGRVPQPFRITERITLHVRHRAKYFEVPMPEEQAFIFTCNGQLIGEQARTLREFVMIQDRLPSTVIEGHAQRGDYSRWVAEVFGDHLLAAEIRNVEKEFRRGRVANLSESLIKLIRERYEAATSGNCGGA